MRPDGMGRCGSLMASTSRSYQSLMAWLMAHTSGPAKIMPVKAVYQFVENGNAGGTTPQAKAHMGGNHVIGFSSSRMADGAG